MAGAGGVPDHAPPQRRQSSRTPSPIVANGHRIGIFPGLS
ncbi:hypothetical protein [Azospirillum largimobile]